LFYVFSLMLSFVCVPTECTRLLQILGLGTAGDSHAQQAGAGAGGKDVLLGLRLQVDVLSTSDSSSSSSSSSGGLIGIQKAMFIEVSYRGLCAALTRLARLGNTAGPIAQDFRADVATSLNIAICHRSAISHKEAKFTMENRASISPAHVSVIWPQLTLHALSLLAVLLSTVGASPLLYPFAGTACSCVSSALAHVFPSNKKTESFGCSDTLTACSLKALECFKYILRSFPTLAISKCEQTLLKFVDIFSQQVQYLTSDPQQQVDSDTSNSFNTNKDVVLASFEVCETLLMTTSALLPFAVRQQLEVAVHRGLQCLTKGVVLHSFLTLEQGGNCFTSQRMLKHVQQNKKVRRELCEAIRSDVDVQKGFLLLACAEVQTSFMDGSRSANLPLLHSAAGVCSNHEVTASVCGRIGLCVGNILFPAGVGLPSPPLVEVAHRKILEHNAFIEQSQDRETRGVGGSAQVMGDKEEPEEEQEEEDTTRNTKKRKGSFETENSNESATNLVTKEVVANDTEAESNPKAPKVNWFESNAGSTASAGGGDSSSAPVKARAVTMKTNESSDDDDDDELPDIDIDADIDA
jgi:hypothetical protein